MACLVEKLGKLSSVYLNTYHIILLIYLPQLLEYSLTLKR